MTQARFLGILILGFRGRGFIRVRSAPYCHVTTPGSALYGNTKAKRTLVGIIREPSQQPMSALTGTIVVALQGTLLGTSIEAL